MGLFTPIYMKGNLSTRQARAAISKVKKMTDQAKLADIARDGKDNSVREAAIDRLNDANLLADFVLNDSDVRYWSFCRLKELRDEKALAKVVTKQSSLDLKYIYESMDLIQDQSLLEQIAKTALREEARRNAVRKLNDQSVLRDIALRDPNATVRAAAAQFMTDSDALAKVAAEDSDPKVRRIAVSNEHMADVALLGRLALKDKDEDVRKAAVMSKYLTDSHVLTQYALHEPEKSNRFDALLHHTLDDEEDLKKIIRETEDGNIRTHAVGQLRDPALLAEIALTSDDASCRLYAVWNRCLTDQATLARIAIQDDWGKVGEACIKDRSGKDRITDPALLRRIATEAASPIARRLAVERLGPDVADALEQIALQDADNYVRIAAIQSSVLTDPDLLYRIATAPDDGEFLSSRMEAALKLSRREPDRAVAPLAALLNEYRASGHVTSRECKDAAAFLIKQYRATDDPAIRSVIATAPNGKYGYQYVDVDNCNEHTDDSVHFDIPR